MFCAKAEASLFHSLGKTSTTEWAAVWSSTGWTVTVPLPQSGGRRGTEGSGLWSFFGAVQQTFWLVISGTCSVHFLGVTLHSQGITQTGDGRWTTLALMEREKNRRAVQDSGKNDTQWQCIIDKNLLNKLLGIILCTFCSYECRNKPQISYCKLKAEVEFPPKCKFPPKFQIIHSLPRWIVKAEQHFGHVFFLLMFDRWMKPLFLIMTIFLFSFFLINHRP